MTIVNMITIPPPPMLMEFGYHTQYLDVHTYSSGDGQQVSYAHISLQTYRCHQAVECTLSGDINLPRMW